MNFRLLLLVCFCCLTGFEAFAQVHYIDRRFWHDDGKVDLEQPLIFDVIPYTSSLLDLRGFRMMHPEIAGRIAEYVEIVPPDLTGLSNLSVAVAWIGVANEEEGQLVMMFMGHFTKESPRYYIDRNLDRVFQNDGLPVIFNPGHTQEKVVFKKEGASAPTIEFWLMAPEDYEEVERRLHADDHKILTPDEVPSELPTNVGEETTAHLAEIRERHFGIRVGISFGLNRVGYNYLAASSGFPVDYEVTSTTKGLFVNGNFRQGGLRVGLFGGFEHMFWWSSYKTTRVSEPFEICDPNNLSNCIFVPGVEVETNRDRLPNLRLNLGLNIEYLLEIIQRVRIGPYLSPSLSTYRPAKYVPEIAFPEQTYRMAPSFSFEGGIRVEVRPTDRECFIFSAAWSESRFRPEGFFEAQDIRLNGLQMQNRGLRAYLGYTFLL